MKLGHARKPMPLLETLPEEHGFSDIFNLCSAILLHPKTEKLNDTFTSSKRCNRQTKLLPTDGLATPVPNTW